MPAAQVPAAEVALAGAGLNASDEAVYRAVLGRPATTPAEVAAVVGQRAERVVAALDRLRAAGLVTRLAGRRRRYAPTEPRSALESLLNARRAELDRARDTIGELAELFTAAQSDSRSAEMIEVLIGRAALGGWFVRMQRDAREEMLTLDRPPYALAASNPIEPVTLSRGVRYRAVYAPQALEVPGALNEIDQLIARGEQARVLPGLPIKLAIADRRIALLPLTLDMTNVRAIVVHSSTLLAALLDLFESYWQQALPLRGLPGGDTDALDDLAEDDQSLLRLLVSGLKDEAIARQLGWSLRTMRRRMRRMLDQLGAENRFQAGVRAARRGWL
ncbi:helix-turn-helix domain-containing protein [Micromonospora sp. WMMD1102]|uniref:TrmB family transcriptional regulator n=1 Tax=Micromonospora sp. WMMD1102 TaxID=3016105 RepID=UPI002415582B|nr:helix-turn-helix domain-containing protein [Micromonospora sp. WMMD1102]MDG4791511.1 helix-turn-helix domain-containing protein [Micromonospora sp. WMMD1102]